MTAFEIQKRDSEKGSTRGWLISTRERKHWQRYLPNLDKVDFATSLIKSGLASWGHIPSS